VPLLPLPALFFLPLPALFSPATGPLFSRYRPSFSPATGPLFLPLPAFFFSRYRHSFSPATGCGHARGSALTLFLSQVRLPRHGASCPVGLGVSCSADRQIKGKITADGVFLEQLETDVGKYLPEVMDKDVSASVVKVRVVGPLCLFVCHAHLFASPVLMSPVEPQPTDGRTAEGAQTLPSTLPLLPPARTEHPPVPTLPTTLVCRSWASTR